MSRHSSRSWPDPHRLGRALDRADAEEDLLDFVRLTWPAIEPARAFVDGWVLGAMAEHLMAVSAGEINRLLINVPPGFMKSLLVNVFWPAWEWGPQAMPETRYLAFSYAEELTKRDNGRFRNLILSPHYNGHWGHVFGPGDQFGRRKIENDRTGWKFASSIGGVGTGERADRVLIDDPNNVKKAESKAVLESTNLWLTEVMPDRLNDQRRSAIILIQQRTNERDCSGTLLALEAGYVHLSVPMEFEPRRYYTNALGWQDPRTREGALAWEERFPGEEVAKLRRIKGPYAYAGQDWHLEEMWNFVHPDHRRSTHAKKLVEFAKWTSDRLGVPLLLGILTRHRLLPKMRLLQRQVPQVGALFLHNADTTDTFAQRRLDAPAAIGNGSVPAAGRRLHV